MLLRPILKNNVPNADQAAVSPWPGEPLDILIIDDSAFIRAFTRIHLAEAGYEVGEMNPTSLFDVLQAIHTHRPALVITDYEMPFCNGETLVRAIREDPVIKEVPIMVLSAHRESDLVERLSQWDLAGYIVKPIKPEDLVATVRRHLLPSKS